MYIYTADTGLRSFLSAPLIAFSQHHSNQPINTTTTLTPAIMTRTEVSFGRSTARAGDVSISIPQWSCMPSLDQANNCPSASSPILPITVCLPVLYALWTAALLRPHVNVPSPWYLHLECLLPPCCALIVCPRDRLLSNRTTPLRAYLFFPSCFYPCFVYDLFPTIPSRSTYPIFPCHPTTH